MVGLNNYFYDVFSSMKWSNPENFLKAQFVIFRCQKYVKKTVHGNDKKNLPWAFKDCTRSLHLSLLISSNFDESWNEQYIKKHRIIRPRRVTRGWKGGGRSPLPFFKNWKSGKKYLDCSHLWVKFSFKMGFLRVFRRKKRSFFRCGAFLSCIVGECLLKCPKSKKAPLKNSWLRAWDPLTMVGENLQKTCFLYNES